MRADFDAGDRHIRLGRRGFGGRAMNGGGARVSLSLTPSMAQHRWPKASATMLSWIFQSGGKYRAVFECH